MPEFRINEHLSVRLEEGKTIIYVNNERFSQCKFLLLNIEVDEIKTFDEIRSIDEASEKLNKSLEGLLNDQIKERVKFYSTRDKNQWKNKEELIQMSNVLLELLNK